jgi:hypothetical protein
LEIVQPCGIIFPEPLSSPESNLATQTLPFQLSRRKSLRGLAFSLVLLGICVFGWGLRYKLSLYDPPHAVSHRMPEAKLLSGKECGEFTVIHVRPPAKTNLPLALSSLALVVVVLTGSGLWAGAHPFGAAHAALSRRSPQSVPLLSFSIRPPPFRH